uniref:Uncharacterized protein n=1 Tax=Setaria viridis TaxID=4556 RepID=A0A4U6VBN9_SETVI|nr:hypothetical protein SEVIR_3G160900v2 [Setaria viridis]
MRGPHRAVPSSVVALIANTTRAGAARFGGASPSPGLGGGVEAGRGGAVTTAADDDTTHGEGGAVRIDVASMSDDALRGPPPASEVARTVRCGGFSTRMEAVRAGTDGAALVGSSPAIATWVGGHVGGPGEGAGGVPAGAGPGDGGPGPGPGNGGGPGPGDGGGDGDGGDGGEGDGGGDGDGGDGGGGNGDGGGGNGGGQEAAFFPRPLPLVQCVLCRHPAAIYTGCCSQVFCFECGCGCLQPAR